MDEALGTLTGNTLGGFLGMSGLQKESEESMDKMDEANGAIDGDVMLTVPDIMKIMGCSDRHITNLRKENLMPQPAKIGALVRWPRKPFMEWINSGCQPILAV